MFTEADLHWLWGALIALGGALWKMMVYRVNAVESSQKAINDKLDAHFQRSENRHIELLNALHSGLASKQDKGWDGR